MLEDLTYVDSYATLQSLTISLFLASKYLRTINS
jgi:hypothetical protein